jgi:rRNA maturation endonuclease Nob1
MGWNHLIAIAKGPIINVHIKGCKQIFYVKTEDFCIPCGSHNFNLFLADATKCLGTAFNFSGT